MSANRLAAALALALPFAALDAGAVPSFARRYGTSCQTCHVAYPKNTPFGESFRRNGYRFPGGLDEDYRRQEPQKLGADAYKDVFPDSVWPGEIPASLPLSAVLASTVTVAPHGQPQVDLSRVGASASLNIAAPLGDWASAWAGVMATGDSAGEAQLGLERVFVMLTPFEKPYATLRIGRFEPSVFSFSTHRSLGPAPWIVTSTVGDDPLALEPAQHGLELAGVLPGGRGAWTAGVVEGAGTPANLAKDGYARLAWKLGGLRLDGESPGGEPALADPAPWREWSLQAGGFGYAGTSALGTPDTASQDDRVVIAGGDLNAQLRDANLVVAYSYAHHERPILSNPLQAIEAHQLLAQLDYVVYPWLVPVLRWERRIVGEQVDDRASAAVYANVRANVRALVLASVEREDDAFELSRLQAGLSVGF